MRSVTLDDIFYVHERNRLFYYDCNKQKNIDKCPSKKLLGKCICTQNCPVNPNVICEEYDICLKCNPHSHNISKKMYIKMGEECPICFEGIYFRKNAFLTPCGHVFHKTCLHNSHISNLISKIKICEESLACPICRFNIPTEHFYNPIKYFIYKKRIEEIDTTNNAEIIKNINFVITLDNLLENLEYNYPALCIFSNNKRHFLGMNKNCAVCLKFHEGIEVLHLNPNYILENLQNDLSSDSESSSEYSNETYDSSSDDEYNNFTVTRYDDDLDY